MKDQKIRKQNACDMLIYESMDGAMNVHVKLEDDMVWLTQSQMAELFGKGRTTIVGHIQNIFKEGELDEKSVCRNFRHTASDGKEYCMMYYNLDVIISVGYRVKSQRGTQFRIWANKVLKEYMMKGFAVRPYINIGEQLSQFKTEIIDRIDALEKDGEGYQRQFDDFYEILIRLIDELKEIKDKENPVKERNKIGFRLLGDQP